MVQIVLMLAALAFPFVAMPLLWRRMKQVRAQVYDEAEPLPTRQPWEETLEDNHGHKLVRTSDPNEDLIALGARRESPGWTISNP